MGVLFPPPDKPLATPFADLKGVAPTAVGMLLTVGAFYDLCPRSNPNADPPQQDQTPVVYRVQAIAVSTTAAPVPFFGNNSDGAEAAIHAAYRRRNAQTRVAQMMSSTSAALLVGEIINPRNG